MQDKVNKINIGLDIGTSSVGWSIIDDNYNIIDMGVRLFDDPAKNGELENVKRRSARHQRRLYSRRRIRKNALKNFLIENHLVNDDNDFDNKINIDITEFANCNNPIELKCKALKYKVSKDELVYILFHYMYHRGYFYLTDEERKKIKKQSKENNNNTNTETKHPSIQLFDFYKKNGYYKDAVKADDKLLFSNRAWVEEIKELLLKQECSNEFIDEYLEIFKRIRKFNEGPGSEKSPTPYGLYRIDSKGNKICIGKNLWDATLGTCSYYSDKEKNRDELKIGDVEGKVYRGLKNAPITELFNLFNDISNIRFNKEPFQITTEMMKQIIADVNKDFPNKTYAFITGGKFNKKIIKLHNQFSKEEAIVSQDDISGYRTKEDKKSKKIKIDFTSLDNYTIIAKYLHDNYDKLSEFKDENGDTHNYKYDNKDDCSIPNISLLEKVNLFFTDIAKNSSDFLSRKKWLDETQKNIDPQENDKLADKLTGLTQSSSLSNIAMLKYIDYFIYSIKTKQNNEYPFNNWTTYVKDNPPYGNKNNLGKKTNYLPSNLMDDEVISPTVRRSFNQACQIVNKIISVYCRKNKNKPDKKIYEINNITIELPRDKNSAEEKKKIQDIQKENKKINDEAKKKFNHIPLEWYKLYKLQNGIDWYDGTTINLSKPTQLQVEHIIPLSISSDDSLSNKVLTHISNNSDKGQNTPYQWLSRNGNYKAYEKRIKTWWSKKSPDEKILLRKKYEYLLYMKDPYDINDFTNRNLVDTRYASRLTLNKFQDFFNTNHDYGDVKIKVVRGAITNLCRNSLFYDKNNKSSFFPKKRELYCHHAIDASLICFIGMNSKIDKLIKWSYEHLKYNKEDKLLHNSRTGEVVDIMNLYDKGSDVALSFRDQLVKYNDRIIKNNNSSLNENDKSSQSVKWQFVSAEKKVHFSRKLISKNNIQLSNQTIYSLREKINNQNKVSYQMISKIDLINDSKDDLDKFFNPENPKYKKNVENLLVYKEDHKLYDLLKQIYNQYLTIDKIEDNIDKDQKKPNNPFVAYMQFEHKDLKANYILLNNNQKVRKLRYVYKEYANKDKLLGIILEKFHNSHAIMESLNFLSLRLYWDLENKPVIVPINAHVLVWDIKHHRLSINEAKLKKLLNSKKINDKNYVELKRGSILVEKNNENNIFYISGFNSKNVEIKPINYSYKYYQDKINGKATSRFFIPINKLIYNYYLAQNDILGKIYNKIDLAKK